MSSDKNVDKRLSYYDRPSHGLCVASNSLPAIHSKTIAKVRKSFGTGKKKAKNLTKKVLGIGV